ncbi:vacuole effluxer Atg22 like-domain-containing protein [Limtongia smithiae]|uniref:vacuole effluxer Atg22 like-domain-containing protein n=1 Tax=Limtongia smithiae TaxID=1125753 RepID=UPI0034D00DCD
MEEEAGFDSITLYRTLTALLNVVGLVFVNRRPTMPSTNPPPQLRLMSGYISIASQPGDNSLLQGDDAAAVSPSSTGFATVPVAAAADNDYYYDGMSNTTTAAELSLSRVRTSFSNFSQLDQRQTSKKEVVGWLSFAFAAEPFAVAAVGVYLPILLEQSARESAVLASDHSVPCRWHSEKPEDRSMKCVVRSLWFYVDPASFALYTFAVSVFLQAIVVISMSGAADRGNFRKKLLLGFAGVGGLSSILFIAAIPKAYHFAAFLTIVGNVSFGAVAVCGNAFLPVLVRNHPDVIDGTMYPDSSSLEETSTHSSDLLSTASTLAVPQSPTSGSHPAKLTVVGGVEDGAVQHHSFESFPPTTVDPDARSYFDHQTKYEESEVAVEVSSRLSGLGVASGYMSAFVVQSLGIAFVAATGSSMMSIRIVLMAIGIWWLAFSVPTALFMRPRPGPKLHMGEHESPMVRYVSYGWKTLWHTAKEVRKLRDVGLYLTGWFILSDSATTINATSILFARTELHMSPASLAAVGIITMIFGIVGAILFSRYAQHYLNMPPNRIIALIAAITAIIPAYGLFGFMTNAIGLHHAWEIYVLAAIYGISLGGMSSVCRSVFSMLIPPGKESTFFSLYAVTDKGSSIVGPTVTAMITDRTHNIRYTFYFLFILLLTSIPIFYCMDIERGKRDARRFGDEEAEEEEENVPVHHAGAYSSF